MAHVTRLHPGSDLAGYRIETVEREGDGAAVFLAHDPHEDRIVALHVAPDPIGALSTVRFLERVRRLGGVTHPHLLGVYGARTLDGRAVAVAQAPPGRRLDAVLADGPLGSAPAVRIARQVASAVDALEDSGAEPPPLSTRRIWVDGAGDAHLDGLDGSGGLTSARGLVLGRRRWAARRHDTGRVAPAARRPGARARRRLPDRRPVRP